MDGTSKTANFPLAARAALSIPECELVAGVKKDCLYREINSGRLRSLKIGKRRLIRREALESWLAEREIATCAEGGKLR